MGSTDDVSRKRKGGGDLNSKKNGEFCPSLCYSLGGTETNKLLTMRGEGGKEVSDAYMRCYGGENTFQRYKRNPGTSAPRDLMVSLIIQKSGDKVRFLSKIWDRGDSTFREAGNQELNKGEG